MPLDLEAAYREVFAAHSEASQIVLNDLAQFTGFYGVLPIGTAERDMQYREGSRAVFARIFQFLSQSTEGAGALDESARTKG